MTNVAPMRITEKRLHQQKIQESNARITWDLYKQGKKKTRPGDDVKKEKKGSIIRIEEAFFANPAKQSRAI